MEFIDFGNFQYFINNYYILTFRLSSFYASFLVRKES